MNIFKRSLDKRERDAGLKTEKVEPKKAKPAEKPKAKGQVGRTMSQAEFSGYAKGGMVKRGYGAARGGGKKC